MFKYSIKCTLLYLTPMSLGEKYGIENMWGENVKILWSEEKIELVIKGLDTRW